MTHVQYTLRNVNNNISVIDRTSRKKIIKDTVDLNITLNQLHLIDSYRICHNTVRSDQIPIAEYKYNFFSSAYRPFTKYHLHYVS